MSLGQAFVELGVKDNLSQSMDKIKWLFESLKKTWDWLWNWFNAIGQRTDALNSKVNTLWNTFGALRWVFLAIGGIVVFKNLLNEVGQFERALIDVKNVASWDFAGWLKDPLLLQRTKELNVALKDLSNRTWESREELAKASVSAIKLGISIKDGTNDLTGFIETLVKIQKIEPDFGWGNAEVASNKLAKLSNILKVPLSEIEQLGSSLSSTASAGTSSVDELVGILNRIGTVGKLVWGTNEQLIWLAGTLVDLGIREELWATAINNGLSKMKAEAWSFATELARIDPQLSKTFKENIWRNWVDALNTFLAWLNKLNSGEQFAMLDRLWLSGAWLSTTILALANAQSIFNKNLNAASQWYSNVEAFNQRFLATFDWVEAKMWFVGNQFKNLGLDIVETLLPAITSVLSLFQVLFNSEQFKVFFSSFTTGIQSMVQGIVTYVIPAFTYFMNAVVPVFQNVIAKVKEVARAIIQIRWWGNGWEILGRGKQIFDQIINIINNAVNVIAGLMKIAVVWFKFLWDNVYKYLFDSLSGVITFVQWVLNILTGNFKVWFTQVLNGIIAFGKWIINAIGWAFSIIGQVVQWAVRFIATMFQGLWKVRFALMLDLLESAVRGFTKIPQLAKNTVKAIWQAFTNIDIRAWLNSALQSVKQWGQSIINYVVNIAKKAWNSFKSIFWGWEWDTWWVDIGQVTAWAMKQAITEVTDWINSWDVFQFNRTKSAVAELWSSFAEFFSPVTDSLKLWQEESAKVADAFWETGNSAKEMWWQLVWAWKDADKLADSLWGSWWKGKWWWAKWKAQELTAEMKNMWTEFKDSSGKIEWLVKKLADWMDKFREAITKTMKELEDGIQKSKDKIRDVNAELAKSLQTANQKFAEDLIWDKTSKTNELARLEWTLENLKKYSSGTIDFSKEVGFMQLVNELLNTQWEKEKVIAQGKIDAFKNATELTNETEKYLETLQDIATKKKELWDIDSVISKNFKDSAWVDLATLQKEASLEWLQKKEADFAKEKARLQWEANDKLKIEEELIRIQEAFQDRLLAKKFFNERQYQNFRKEILANEDLSKEWKDEALKLAEKFKALWDEKNEIQKVNADILTLKEDLSKKEAILSEEKNKKLKESLWKEIQELEATIAQYERLAKAKELAFWTWLGSINGNNLSKEVTTPWVQSTEDVKKTAQVEADAKILAEQTVATKKDEIRAIDKTKESTDQLLREEAKKVAREKELLDTQTQLDALRVKHETVNNSIRSTQRLTTDMAIQNMYREMSVVQQQIQSYYALASAKRAAWEWGFFWGGFTWWGFANNIPWFATWWFTWFGNIRNVAWVVHKWEYVIPNKVLKRIAPTGMLWVLERMRRWFFDWWFTSPATTVISPASSNFTVNQTVNDFRDAESALYQLSYLYKKFR